MSQQMGKSAAHAEFTLNNISSYYIGCISYNIFAGQLCFRAMFSEDVDIEKGEHPTFDAKWKFPGGMFQSYEVIDDTMIREWMEEAMRKNTGCRINMDHVIRLFHRDGPDESVSDGIHRKVFFLFDERKLENYRGDIHFRASPKLEVGGGIIYPTTLMRVPTLHEQMVLTQSHSHRQALIRAADYLAANDRHLLGTMPNDFLEYVSNEMFENRWERQWDR